VRPQIGGTPASIKAATIGAERAKQLQSEPLPLKASFPLFLWSAFVSSCIERMVHGLANLDSEEAEGIDSDQCKVCKVR
jgi:hypothetical protein